MRKLLNEAQIESRAAQKIESFKSAIINEVEKAVAQHEWVMIGMGQNVFPKKARQLFQSKGIAVHELSYGNYFSMWKERLAIKMWSGWPTFPQIFHKGKLIGGFTDLEAYLKNT